MLFVFLVGVFVVFVVLFCLVSLLGAVIRMVYFGNVFMIGR